MARPVLELLREAHPSAQFAYSFFSPSAAPFARSLDVDVADYLPFDTPVAGRAMLSALRPRVLVFSKLDVWPMLVEAAVARRVPVALTSATVSVASRRASSVARWFLRDAYASLSTVGAVHEDDAARLVALGVPASVVTVTGDVRYDQVWQRVNSASANATVLARLRSARPTLVAGSTWPADEAALLAAWSEVTRRIPGARLILAAHEPSASHTARMMRAATQAGRSAATIDTADGGTDVVIVDRVGLLADLYAVGGVAFVGGGFHGNGLHSVVEPAAHGRPVIVGPAGATSRDARDLTAAAGGFVEATSASLADRLVALLSSDDLRVAAGARAREVIERGLGAARRSAALLSPFLPT